MTFFQDPPRLENQFDDDELLREYLARSLPADMLAAIRDDLRDLGELAAGHFYRLSLADRENEPRLVHRDPWGNRIDRVDVSPLWVEAEKLAATRGLVAAGYDTRYGQHARVHQFAMNYLVQASLDVYSCPLAMTDGATRTLLTMNNQELIDRAVPHLTSRDPEMFWTSGQWMTEKTGGSDVGLSETVAKKTADGWRLYGEKWFTSAAASQVALTLARPEGNGQGGKGLALFYLETHLGDGGLGQPFNGIRVERLKDKLGTRKVPTAELTLDGALATPVNGLSNGTKNIVPMLNITRTWNTMAAAWSMRRILALSKDYARRRVQFGASLSQKPLHVDTLAGLQAEFEGAFHLGFLAASVLGRTETGHANESETLFLRMLTPIAKLTTGRQAMAVVSEGIESFGGAGYVEDTGLPRILADTQVLPIWEGTTNVLSLDTVRAMARVGVFEAFISQVETRLLAAKDPALRSCLDHAATALAHAQAWLADASGDRDRVEAGARRFALTLGRTLALSLLVEHAQWCLDNDRGKRALAAARRFTMHGVDMIAESNPDDSNLLSA